MTSELTPPRIVLLAVHLASKSDIAGLTALASQHTKILHQSLLLRILLSCLPETLRSADYVPLLKRIESGSLLTDEDLGTFDTSSINDITDEEATKKLRKLKLLSLTWEGAPQDASEDSFALFLLQRAHRVDEEAGLLTQLPELVEEFLNHAPCIKTWAISSLLPLLRRNFEYYPNAPISQTLSEFESLGDAGTVELLLSQTGIRDENLGFVGRDLRGLVGPWLYNSHRWTYDTENDESKPFSQGWEHMLEWLTSQASSSWKVAVNAVNQWDGAYDVDLANYGSLWFGDEERMYLERRWARAVLASAYLITEPSMEALGGVNSIITKVMSLLDMDPAPTLQVASSMLSPYADEGLLLPRNATFMRNDLLDESNPLTTPSEEAAHLLHVLTLSAFILTKAGVPCTVRRAGELAYIQDEREQKEEALKIIQSLGHNGPKSDDKYWIRARNELLWLRDWGAEELSSETDVPLQGVFGRLPKEFLEVECLKAFLANGRYSLARSIYESVSEQPLDPKVLQETVISAAMSAYDNASNPNRGRGGLLKCDDIIHSFPITVAEGSPEAVRIEALLKATHALSEYRLVLKQGEPFMPVVLRVHKDPISIVGKVLEQNPQSYTSIQDFLEIGVNMVNAGLNMGDKSSHRAATRGQLPQQRLEAEIRITAMCIDAALTEDDFETAFSYVVGRLTQLVERSSPRKPSSGTATDDYAWRAALQAGRYRRTAQTLRPTHIGTASGNPDIRHLNQRVECLSTALRFAPAATLPEILNVFRKCEEELHAAVQAEEEQEAAWDERGDRIMADDQVMPGAFSSAAPAGVVRGQRQANARSQNAEAEAPMSLFDLSRASVARAQRNFAALSSLQHGSGGRTGAGSTAAPTAAGDSNRQSGEFFQDDEGRVRKRDQLKDAAVGTLASGVGWLIGAQPVDRGDR